MEKSKDPELCTRERILRAACKLFAEKGFNKTTNKMICDMAEANIAAVNYYFRSKEDLYAQAWRKAFHDSLKAYPPDGDVPADAPPQERLRGRIGALIHQIADENNQALLIAHKEMAAPTRLLMQVHRECIRPLQRAMEALVRELLGPDVPQSYVHFCQSSVEAQCLGVMRQVRRARDSGTPHCVILDDVMRDIDGYIEHVVRFSLAGIRATRDFAGSTHAGAENSDRATVNRIAGREIT